MKVHHQEDGINCMIADENNHLNFSQPPPRRPFAGQRMDVHGNLLPRYCLAPDTLGEIAVVPVRDENSQMIQGLVKAGKAYPVPIADEGVCQSFMNSTRLNLSLIHI